MSKKKRLVGWFMPVNGPCQVIEIDDTLEALQKVVGGYIETVRLTTELIVICNEEGRLLGLPPNQHLFGLVGDALIVGEDGDEFRSLIASELEALRRSLH